MAASITVWIAKPHEKSGVFFGPPLMASKNFATSMVFSFIEPELMPGATQIFP